jgi:hypothetical protein
MKSRFELLFLALPALGLLAACSSSSNSTATPSADGGDVPEASTDAPAGGTQCTKARDDLLLPIDKTSTGEVSVVSDEGGTKTIYVDASAGGIGGAALKNPRIYIDLEAGAKVSVTDKSAPDSTAWDLAIKRDVIFTNSGDAGIGQGGAIQLNKSPAQVSSADASAATLERERFFDGDCNPQLDPTGAPSTTFSDWYEYDQVTHIPAPKNVTYVVRGGTGKKYKVGLQSYSGAPDGGVSTKTGAFIIQVTAL